jgi:GT2 family glycosyltransferase
VKVAVVILNYNGKQYLEKFLNTVVLYSTDENVEIFVADNASTDDSIGFLQEKHPSVKCILLDKNYGFAGGYNKALQQIDAEYFILLNSDVEVTENWWNPILNHMDSHPEVAACQPKILSYREKEKFEHAGAAGGFIDKFGYPFCRGRLFTKMEIDSGQYNNMIDIFWATGACLVIRKNDFWNVGGFDDAFFAHMEEIDLCWRLRSRGRIIRCVPESVVYHVGGGTLSTENPQKTYLNFRNNLLMLYKNLPQDQLTRILLIRFFLDFIALLQMLLGGKIKNALKVSKAHRDFLRMRKDFSTKREENLAVTINPYPAEILRKSIVFQFYIKGKRTYSEIKDTVQNFV